MREGGGRKPTLPPLHRGCCPAGSKAGGGGPGGIGRGPAASPPATAPAQQGVRPSRDQQMVQPLPWPQALHMCVCEGLCACEG